MITIPAAPKLLLPVLEVVPLQLLAYHIAVRRDAMWISRNLAKSATVERMLHNHSEKVSDQEF